ncbi:MAG: tripartite tricarboxylate transporter TctB family protein [Elioraea sp.]|nr:tripartite tricarboxylate transporter TctB family protein [Elioraea sp.]
MRPGPAVMRRIDLADVVGGLLLVAFGLWFGSYALEHYAYGTARRMGPGYFPAWVGFLVAGLGGVIALFGLFRSGDPIFIRSRPLIAVIAATGAFALTVERFGVVPAVVVLVFVAALGESPYRLVRTALLALGLAALAVVLFAWGLGIPFQPFRWNP